MADDSEFEPENLEDLAEELEKELDQQDNPEARDYEKILRNRQQELDKKIETEFKTGERQEKKVADHSRHWAEISLISTGLMSMTYLSGQGVYAGIWTLLGFATFPQIAELLGKNNKLTDLLRNHPVAYFVSGFSASIIFEGFNYSMPRPEFGLLFDLATVLLGT
ncbi:MAG: hypothetical protein ABEJ56_00135 [Candidatus Nanohaloarchaea archaeon]